MAVFVNSQFVGRGKLLRNMAYDMGLFGLELSGDALALANDYDVMPDIEGNPIRDAYAYGRARRKEIHGLSKDAFGRGI